MIALLNEENQAVFKAACSLDPAIGAQLQTDLAIYGTDSSAADFWVATDDGGAPKAALCRVHGRMLLAAGEAAVNDELSGFVGSVGGWNQLRANATVCEQLNQWGGVFTAPVMAYEGPAFEVADSPFSTPALPQLYELLCTGFPDFAQVKGWDGWYAMASHLFRHKLGYALGIHRDGQLASTAGVYAMSGDVGLIACVSTRKEYRGMGYAGLLVRCLCNRILAGGRTPMLQCGDDSLTRYYGAMGFVERGHWGKITR